MKGFILFLSLVVLPAFSAVHSAAVVLYRTNRSVTVYDYRVANVGHPVAVVNAEEPRPSRVVWVLHGYKPKGDPYKQSPFVIIKKWELEKAAVRNKWVFILPDMGPTVYSRKPLSKNSLSDIDWLHNAFSELGEKYGSNGAPVFLIGISTGVEGAVKLSALSQPTVPVIALSGTFDLFSVPEKSGEYKLHRKAFGPRASVWTNENPMQLFTDGRRYTIYLFCEERSLFYDQALLLGSSGMKNVEVRNYLRLGKDRGHNWDFWGDPAVVKTVFGIIGK